MKSLLEYEEILNDDVDWVKLTEMIDLIIEGLELNEKETIVWKRWFYEQKSLKSIGNEVGLNSPSSVTIIAKKILKEVINKLKEVEIPKKNEIFVLTDSLKKYLTTSIKIKPTTIKPRKTKKELNDNT